RPFFPPAGFILAPFLPIYVLAGPSGKLFDPMADTSIFALIGALIVTLTLLPVLCAWFLRRGVRERRNPGYEWMRGLYARPLTRALERPWWTIGLSTAVFVLSMLFIPHIGAEFM